MTTAIMGPDHHTVAQECCYLATLHDRLGNGPTAISLLTKAEKVMEKTEDDTANLVFLGKLAETALKFNDQNTVEKYAKKSLDLINRKLEPEVRANYLGPMLSLLGSARWHRGDDAQAAKDFEEVIRLTGDSKEEKLLVFRYRCRSALGVIAKRSNDLPLAIERFNAAIADVEAQAQIPVTEAAQDYLNLSHLLMDQKRHKEAIKPLKRWLAMCEERKVPAAEHVAPLSLLADAYHVLGDKDTSAMYGERMYAVSYPDSHAFMKTLAATK